MSSSSYRPRRDARRDDVPTARALAARQLTSGRHPGPLRRSVPELLAAFDDELDDEPSGGPSDEPDDAIVADEGFAPRLLPDAVADRLPPGLRAVRWQVSRRAAAGVLLVLTTLLAVAGFLAWRNWPTGEVTAGAVVPARSAAPTGPVAAAGPVAPAGSVAPQTTAEPSGEVVVHVAGQVLTPGLVTLSAGSRVADAVAAAGGPVPGADLDAVNLARPLVDGEQVVVPTPGAAPGTAPTGAGTPGAAPAAGAGPLDLNTATAADLDSLPGVGEVLAGRIVAWREENGPLSSVDDLGEVTGIGPKVLEGLRGLVTV